MNRLLSSIRNDIIVQFRSNLYYIGIVVGVLIAFILGFIFTAEQLPTLIPSFMIIVGGGSTMLYIASLILFEKDQGTINAALVSPLKTSEYILSKIITLTILATFEAIIMIGGAMLIFLFSSSVTIPNIPILLLGIIAMSIVYTLIGIILIVRYKSILEFIIPMSVAAMVLQVPALYFFGWIKHWIFLIIPTSAPAMIIQGAYSSLTILKWVYGLSYTLITIAVLGLWSYKAYQKYIVMRSN